MIFDQRRAQAAVRLLAEIVEAGRLLVPQQHFVEIVADDIDHQPFRAEALPRIDRVIEIIEQRTAGRAEAVDAAIAVLLPGQPALQCQRIRHHSGLDIAVADHRQERSLIAALVILIVDEAIIVDMAAVDIGQERAARKEEVPVRVKADDRVCGVDRLDLIAGMDRQQSADALREGEPQKRAADEEKKRFTKFGGHASMSSSR